MDEWGKFNNAFRYDPDTGFLYWKSSATNSVHVGDRAGSKTVNIYRTVMIFNKAYFEHRVIWFLYYKKWPSKHIDHINGIRDDNRICNLREVTDRENNQNLGCHREGRSVGTFQSKYYSKRYSKWYAKLKIHKVSYPLGPFETEEEAASAYLEAAAKADSDPNWVPYIKEACAGCREEAPGRWRVRIIMNHKEYGFGSYPTFEEAHEVYMKAKKELKEKKALNG